MDRKSPKNGQSTGINTRLAHGPYDPAGQFGFVNPPVFHASTVLFADTATLKSRSRAPYSYGLSGTPTTRALEDALNELEGSAGTILLPSGLAAVTFPLLAFLGSGDHCLVVDSVYPPTRRFCDTVLKRMGVEVTYFDPAEAGAIAGILKPNSRAILLEAPGSNTFEMIDVAALTTVARAAGVVTMMDNTWATPLFFRPLDHGVDLSIHALTKYPGGHSDMMLGSVSATAETYGRLRETQMMIGVNAAPDDTYLCLRGLKTMGVRLARHEASALEVANWLESREDVLHVLHPALPSFEGHELWKRQFSGASGLFSFVLRDGDAAGAARFLDALRLFGLGFSWGGHESLAVPVDLSDRVVAKAPSGGAVIRLQIGLEDVPDLVADLERGFAAYHGG
ncbi:cystathionine beta-lyase [Aurantimonas sp. Leaf443]|uniref:cystathionine beta-lyase n=1 Tax=Aurantimonas sp. Leaf443 TaxID=1736378 RepID=UPI0006F21F24|nr:cystathionine beta-lyase [Aurantimonas sp. Leaf443]KQT86291.1 cystathionine beta-lyase [Aurantimonas sp. Leaf443]